MKRCEDLKSFLRQLVLVLSHGYHSYDIVRIPIKKQNEATWSKIERIYKTDVTRNKRAWNKHKNISNFQAVQYRDICVILHTKGEVDEHLKQELKKKWKKFPDDKFQITISEHVAFKIAYDERKKITVFFSNETYAGFKNALKDCFINKKGNKFHEIVRKMRGFPPYRGIQMQKKQLASFIRESKKNQKVNWSFSRL